METGLGGDTLYQTKGSPQIKFGEIKLEAVFQDIESLCESVVLWKLSTKSCGATIQMKPFRAVLLHGTIEFLMF